MRLSLIGRIGLLSSLGLLALGCADGPDAPAEEANYTLRSKDKPANGILFWASPPAEAVADPRRVCGACGGEPGCMTMCLYDGALFEANPGGVDDDCIVCGRETGFLPATELKASVLENGQVSLAWEAISDAQSYTLHAFRWAESPEMGDASASMEWETELTSVSTRLELGFSYMFYVVAHTSDRKRHSAASNVVRIDL